MVKQLNFYCWNLALRTSRSGSGTKNCLEQWILILVLIQWIRIRNPVSMNGLERSEIVWRHIAKNIKTYASLRNSNDLNNCHTVFASWRFLSEDDKLVSRKKLFSSEILTTEDNGELFVHCKKFRIFEKTFSSLKARAVFWRWSY